MNGICTLANDRVYDQLIALLNSIESVMGKTMPVCIYPFDDQCDRIRLAIRDRPSVTLYDDQDSIQRWDSFMQRIAPERLNQKNRLYGAHRRFCAFDGPFDRFVYMDADTLAMSPLDRVFQMLDKFDWVVYDYQFLDPSKIYNVNSSSLYDVFSDERIRSEVFCSGFFAAKRGLFGAEQRETLIAQLRAGDINILYEGAGEQPVLNYMVMRSGLKSCNLGSYLPSEESTGCSVTSKHFEERNHILYDRGTRLTYLHYIGVKPQLMEQVCLGENVSFPYRNLFLYYRFLHQPQKCPVFMEPPSPDGKSYSPGFVKKVLKKLKLGQSK
ncbi:Npun_R2821/Npun_R2822 family protein [Myxacorys almedinensis]|uniref:Sugar transferase n=1 Tax=Myxacorys almedinensis A TaxID=2690445 RepID=A0A8J8CHZ6_9CYAN|nr:Npun_R2821/Npun_R2822 family protein [Myxacorys almedinensis]NDJ17223.1 sugar transferase [Myxacorys almedinensis A]